MMTGNFINYVANNGFASNLLYHGPKVTDKISTKINFVSETGKSSYGFKIAYSAGDNFIFLEENIKYERNHSQRAFEKHLADGGYKESKLKEVSYNNKTAQVIRKFLSNIRVFHFHDTSKTAYIHQASPISSNSYLLSDGGNLASVLYDLSLHYPKYYQKIVDIIKMVAPFFDDFILNPQGDYVKLKFKEINSDLEQDSYKLSDGTIRFIALITLLSLPHEKRPKIIIIDEPELGLHPVAIDLLSEAIRKSARHTQIFITTQSERLINNFEPENIITINRKKDENNRYYSDFKKLDKKSLENWIDEYSLSDLWNSNIIGAKP